MQTDEIYQDLLQRILDEGDRVESRNAATTSHIALPQACFTEFPLVTLRKTAAAKAIEEMAWFFSGDSKCPDNLLSWWDGQLDDAGRYCAGYSEQFRAFTGVNYNYVIVEWFDQIAFVLDALKSNPNSRRIVLTSWNPHDMAVITKINANPNTPTTCHTTIAQFFVRNGKLHMSSYMRSADMLLGAPHNWVQSWAMLLYFAHWAKLEVGSMRWIFGDAHIYDEPSHMQAAREILACGVNEVDVVLKYAPSVGWTDAIPEFKASDFVIEGAVPAPKVLVKPKLL
jgi:thymidylate synthase